MNANLRHPAYAKPTTLGEHDAARLTAPKIDTQPTRVRPAPLPGIYLTGPQISDLFFNAEHPHYDGVDRSEINENVAEDLKAALLKDAEFFADLTGNQITPAALAADFVHRL